MAGRRRDVQRFDAIQVGETQTLTKHITEADVRKFVEMTGDDNPLHVDRAYAETTAFKDIVVHGMLGASFISTVIGTKLPGTWGAVGVAEYGVPAAGAPGRCADHQRDGAEEA
jgi:3-oxoacyl-[acyl-carrier protein] reductase